MLGQGNCLLRSPFLLCILIGLLMHSVVGAEIPLGSKLSVVDNDYWVSSNGDFAIGFFNISDQPNQFSVGIRFNSKSIPYSRQTVVWVAGGDVTVGNESYFELTHEGELVLFDSLHEAFAWTPGTGKRSVASASLLDNGNLVLMDKEQHIIWESFRTPSDTLLPGQNLFANEKLRAASAIKNSKSSYYSLHMNASGHLELHWESDVIYWTSENPSSASNLSAFLTTNGALELRDRRSKAVWSAFGQDHNDSVNYRYLRLDVDGNLRLYSWVESLGLWRSVWQAVENQCKVFATCGELGVCVFNASGSAECKCPFQVSAGNKCLVPFERDCASGTNMIAYKNTYLYAFYPPDNSVITSNLQHCEQLCLNDPHCTAATFSNDRTPLCSIKKTGYVTGYSDPSVSSISFAKRCSGPIAVNPSFTKSPPSEPPPPLCVPCLMGAATGTFFIIVILQLGIMFIYRRKNSTRQKATLGFIGTNSKGLIVLSFSEIKTLTGDFKNQIGPKVFKGLLPNNLPIALKDLNATLEERKFRSAVMKMGCIHHKNLVKLEGYCCEFDHRFLVYEYCKKGSLDKYIDDPALCKMLTWRKRVEICSSMAKAICYLHSGCREFISHGNLKCENVMLDENLVAKVSEFGFAIADGKATYCGFSAEKDVEDFGKVVLALLTGCRDHEHVELCGWAYKEWMEERVVNVIDRRMEGGYNSEELERVLRIAFWCLQMDERRRPSMGEVVRVIDGTLSVDPPPPPFAFQRPLQVDDSEENVSEFEV